MKNANQQVKPVLAAAPSTGEGGSDPSSPSLSRQPTPHPSTMELRTAEAVDSNVGAVNNADTASADGDLLRKLQSNSLSASEFRGRLREMVKTQSETKGGSIASSSSLKGMERELVMIHRTEEERLKEQRLRHQQTMRKQRRAMQEQTRELQAKDAGGGAIDSFAEYDHLGSEHNPAERFDDFMWRLFMWRLYVTTGVEILVGFWTDSAYTQLMIGILGILDAINYVMLTYEDDQSSRDKDAGLGWMVHAYGFTTAYYCVDLFCFCVDAEGGPLTYMLSVQGFVDLVAVLEGMVELLFNHNMAGLRIFKLIKVLRIVKMMRLVKINESTYTEHEQGSVGAEMTKLVVYMVIILFVFSSFIHAVENPDYVWRTVFDLGDVDAEMLIDNKSDSEELFHWHDAFYFMVVTFTTVGYGDVYPARPLSRMLIVGIIAFSFVFIPWQSSTLLSAFLNQDSYSGAYKGSNHIILCLQEGFEPHRVMYFLDEMMQSSDESERVLLLCPSPPSPDLKILFSRFYPRIQYLNGSATVYQDLRRAKFSAARAVLILACPTLSSELDDKRVFLSCVALGTDIDVEKRVIAQCRKPKTKATLMSMGINSVIYLEDVKMAMLGVGLIVPGFLAFFSNLLKSEPHVKLSGEWSLDYFKGALHEIYLFPVSEQIVKMRFPPSFREFGAAVYEYNHSVLLGIMSTPDESDVDYGVSEGLDLGIDGSCNSSGKRHKRGVCLVNPTDHLINQPMVLFIMSKDKATALSAIFSAEAFILADSNRSLHRSVRAFSMATTNKNTDGGGKEETKSAKKAREHIYVDPHSRYCSRPAGDTAPGASEPSEEEGGGAGEGHLNFGTAIDGTFDVVEMTTKVKHAGHQHRVGEEDDEYGHATLNSMVDELSQVLLKADELLMNVNDNIQAMATSSEPVSPSTQSYGQHTAGDATKMCENDIASGEVSAANAALLTRDLIRNAKSFTESARSHLQTAGAIVREHGQNGTLGWRKEGGKGAAKSSTVRLVVHLSAAERKATLHDHFMICMRSAEENKAFYLLRTIRLLSKAPVVMCIPNRKVYDQLLQRLELYHHGFSKSIMFYESSFIDKEGLVTCHAESATAVMLMMGHTVAEGKFQQQSIDCDVLMEGHQLRAYLASKQALTRVHAIYEFFHEQSIVSMRGHYRDYTPVERRSNTTREAVVTAKEPTRERASLVDRDGDLVMSSQNIRGLSKQNSHLWSKEWGKTLSYKGSYIHVSLLEGVTQNAKSRLLSTERGKKLEDQESGSSGRRSKMHKISVADSHGRPLFAAGQAFVASTLDMLTIQSLQDPEELCFWHKVMGIEPVGSIMGHSFDGGIEEGGGDDDGGGGANSGQSPLKSQLQIQAIKVPIEFVGETYAHLFREIMALGDISVGLYRPQGHKGSAMRYMLTNPPPITKLVKDDLALVIISTNETLPMTAFQRQNRDSLEKELAKRAVSVETKSKLLASRGGLSGGSFRTPPGDSSRGPGDSGAGQESKGGCR